MDSSDQDNLDQRYMRMAIDQAYIAEENGDVPIGAIIVHENRVIARAHNQRQLLNDPTAHAEMIALTQASEAVGNWRLHGCTIYVTLEPCPMCAGAIIQARIRKVYIGAPDPKAGAAGSVVNLFAEDRFNHKVEAVWSILEEECSSALKNFFAQLRDKNR